MTLKSLVRRGRVVCLLLEFLDTEPCEWALPAIARDGVLTALSKAAAAVRRDTNANFIARRGALMHTDIAMMGLAAPASIDSDARRESSVRMSFSDGQQTALTEADRHWEFARKLLDLVAAPGTIKPAPSGDAMVRRWYVATAAWTELNGHHENTHMARGPAIFPDDPDLAMLTGAQHELYATAAVQTAVRSAVLPTGVRLSVESERLELREAERFLRRATELKPDFAEAQIRLGRVLAIMGRDAEAAEHLRRGLATTDEHLLLYYGSLFLGAVEANLTPTRRTRYTCGRRGCFRWRNHRSLGSASWPAAADTAPRRSARWRRSNGYTMSIRSWLIGASVVGVTTAHERPGQGAGSDGAAQ